MHYMEIKGLKVSCHAAMEAFIAADTVTAEGRHMVISRIIAALKYHHAPTIIYWIFLM